MAPLGSANKNQHAFNLLANNIHNVNVKLEELSKRMEVDFQQIKEKFSIIDGKMLVLEEHIKHFKGDNELLEVMDIN